MSALPKTKIATTKRQEEIKLVRLQGKQTMALPSHSKKATYFNDSGVISKPSFSKCIDNEMRYVRIC